MIHVILTGWTPGLQGVSFILLIKEKAGFTLATAKACLDRLLAGDRVAIALPTVAAAEDFVREAYKLGVICEVEQSLFPS